MTILIPVEFSSLSYKAMNFGVSLAKKLDAKIVLVHVLSPGSLFLQPFIHGADAKKFEQLRESLLDKLEFKRTQIIKTTGVDTKTILVDGLIDQQICKVAKDVNADIIVMGVRRMAPPKNLFFRSVSLKVFARSPCNVITVPEDWKRKEIKKVVFPIDYNSEPLEKFAYVWPVIMASTPELFMLGREDSNGSAEMQKLNETITLLKIIQFKSRLTEMNIKVDHTMLSSKNFSEKTFRTAEKFNADMFVLTGEPDINGRYDKKTTIDQRISKASRIPVLRCKQMKNFNCGVSNH